VKLSRFVVCLGFCIALSSCSSKPSQNVLSSSILEASRNNANSDISEEVAECIAEVLISSGLSDTTLEGLAKDFTRPKILGAESERLTEVLKESSDSCETT